MRTRLISIPTDTFPLDGVMYEPGSKVLGSALYFHGNTMNFYTGAARFLPEAMCALGLVFVAFNRRGHDILSTRASRQAVGGAYQTVAESVADNAFAATWMKEQGYANPIILGHSYGGMLSTQHVVDHPATPALILLSAGRGGIAQDTTGGTEKLFAMDRLEETHHSGQRIGR
ncbi:MAG: alpha/beta hydrolase [Betaproteobacteria bacterium]|nr:alpha/beta hydrolase [Betaproteobacteria bacterium]